MTPRIRPSGPMVVLAVITLVLSSYGLFRLAVDFAGVPPLLGLLTVAGFDLFAVACGKHALTVAHDGDSSAPWNALVVIAAVLSAVMQYGHAVLAGQPALVGVMFAFFPIATVCLFEGTLRRAYRLNGRTDGRVAPARATFELLQWIVYFKATKAAFRLAVADRALSADAAFKMGILADQAASRPTPPPQRREVALSYSDILSGQAQLVSGHGSDTSDTGSDTDDELSDEVSAGSDKVHRVNGGVAEVVRTALDKHGPNYPVVRAVVRERIPNASEQAIRRAFDRKRATA